MKARYFQRSWGSPSIVESFNVEVPEQWVLNSWVKRQEAHARNPKKVNSVWREFSQLPGDYRNAISENMNHRFGYGWGDDHFTWVMLHLECMFEKRHRNLFDRGSGKEVVGVFLVMKQNKKPGDSSAELVRFARENDENMAPVVIENEYDVRGHSRGATNRHRVSRNGYEPRHSVVYMRGEPSRSKSRRPTRESYYSAREDPEIDLPYQDFKKREVEERALIEREREREEGRAREYVRSPQPQRSTRYRERMNDGSDPRHIPKYVSFAKDPNAHPRERYSAPYVGFSWPYDERPPSPRRRPGRSRSPRSLRRSGTGMYLFSSTLQKIND